jgi:hypothetical protein
MRELTAMDGTFAKMVQTGHLIVNDDALAGSPSSVEVLRARQVGNTDVGKPMYRSDHRSEAMAFQDTSIASHISANY